MYLKRLELVGFKSFADKTEFTFPSSVTCVVGPNGCGKSNVVDAFKWIFGEQSAKGLRGEEMKDVIFNGTLTRKPTGMSEVTVVFDNADHALDIDYSEVAITRRLFRSGESDYLINKQKCRLRDIRELLLGTGLGATSYTILEQGKIDVLLQASTLDRRIVFEEAAGISKYRARKAETLRALQRTEENLARLGDIIDEVEKRMHRVKVQAGKARRYREHYERMKSLRVRAALEDWRALVAERTDITCRRYLAEHRLRRLEGILAALQAGLDRRRRVRLDLEEHLAADRERLAEARTGRERTEERIDQDRRRLVEMAQEIERKTDEKAAAEEAGERIDGDLLRHRAERESALEEIARRRSLLEAKSTELEGIRLRLEGLRAEMELSRAEVVATLHERSGVGNRVVQLTSELGNLAGRKDRVGAHLEASQRELAAQGEVQERLDGELREMRERLDGIDRARMDLEARSEARRGEIQTADAELSHLRAAVQDRRSRLDVLRRFEESREGIRKAVTTVLAGADPTSGAAQVRGMVGEILRVERRFAPAVEAVLGEHAQSLVVESQEGGLGLLKHIQEGDAGAIEVIALDRVGPAPGASLDADGAALSAEAGVLGWIRDRVDGPVEFREVLDRLLDRVILVEDLSTAVALSRNGLSPYRMVTLDGAVIEPWGSMSIAGSDEAGGIISRRSEMAELEAQLLDLEKAHRETQAGRDGLVQGLRELEKGLRDSLQAREAEALRIGSTQGLLQQAVREKDRAAREVRVGESELSEILASEGAIRLERAAAEEAALALDRRREAAEAILKARDGEAAAAAAEHRTAGEAFTELKVGLAEAEERGEGLRRALERLDATLAEEDRRRKSLANQVHELHRREAETQEDLERSVSAMDGIISEEKESAALVEAAEVRDKELSADEAACGTGIDRIRLRSGAVREERERLNLREQEGKLKRNALVEKMADEYGLDLAAIAEGRTEAPSCEAAPPAGPVSGESPAAPGAPAPLPAPTEVPWDRNAADVEIQELREKLRHIGNVNLEALDELEELEQRDRFMTAQREDLRKAQKDLQEIIAEINRTSRELFLKTFETVQSHFNDIFRKCFGGGMAELVLEEGVDVLEAGIEIIARPPGKKLTSLSLMSGGEKTMTTIALLFAIFRSKPSPFCILDEVDAPLDENNVRRFVVLLKDFVRDTQFIIITHNKITMAEGDTLYGVTMEERGVSKRVAVEFESYDPDHPEMLAAAAAAAAAPGTGDLPESAADDPPDALASEGAHAG